MLGGVRWKRKEEDDLGLVHGRMFSSMRESLTVRAKSTRVDGALCLSAPSKSTRTEWLRQARFYRDALRLKLQTSESYFNAKKKWRELSTTIDRKAEYLWQHTLFHLRAMTPKKETATNNPVHTLRGVVLPEPVRSVLRHGPKLATEPTCSPYYLLTYVRQVARQIPEGERDSVDESLNQT
ncbi:hypothetical protein HPB50_001296 [Hyalomma asiaticum]|uniref:Uncharacterized protein n=1 Tax=Hyalomma asiaticum TaxID=266040 RepID=A0ACB7RM38_HYAAI|nr:hypothetical protein HPB50_001296 [Hyalomma asiaticum]